MSATNKTSNYDLPIFVGTDIPSWLVDWNGAMTSIDSDLATINGVAQEAKTDSGSAISAVGTIQTSVTNIQNQLTALSNTVSTIGEWVSVPVTINTQIPNYRSGFIVSNYSPTLKLFNIYGTIEYNQPPTLTTASVLFTLGEGRPNTSSNRTFYNAMGCTEESTGNYQPRNLSLLVNGQLTPSSTVPTSLNANVLKFQFTICTNNWA